jgi:hypothetical protein
MAKKSVCRVGLLVNTEHSNGYFHVTANPVYVGNRPRDIRAIDEGWQREPVPAGRITNCSDEPFNGLDLDDLRVYSQGNDEDRSRSNEDSARHLYAWEVQYDSVGRVDRSAKLRAMANTLDTLRKRMSTMANKYGEPASFGQYLMRVAQAIGATEIIIRRGANRGWSYDDCDYDHLELKHGAYQVDRIVKDWVKAGQSKPQEV